MSKAFEDGCEWLASMQFLFEKGFGLEYLQSTYHGLASHGRRQYDQPGKIAKNLVTSRDQSVPLPRRESTESTTIRAFANLRQGCSVHRVLPHWRDASPLSNGRAWTNESDF